MSKINGAATASQWQAPVSCADPFVDLGSGGHVPPPAKPTHSTVPIAELVRGYATGNAALAAEQNAVAGAGDAVISAFMTAQTAIARFRTYVAVGSARVARCAVERVERRHVNDGPEDRRARPDWAKKWVVWILILASAIFDGAFIGSIFQRAFDAPRYSLLYWVSFLPGIGVVIGLLCAGTLVAQSVVRFRSRRERRPVRGRLDPMRVLRRLWYWREEPLRRNDDDLPWAAWVMPILVTVGVLGPLGLWAYYRAAQMAQQNPDLEPVVPQLAVLVLLLGCGAILVKVLSHNPYADSADDAKNRIDTVKKEAHSFGSEARARIADHGRAWNRLHTAIVQAEESGRRHIDEARARVLESLGSQTDVDELRQMERSLTEESKGSGPLATLNLDAMRYAHHLSEVYHPDRLEEAIESVQRELDRQLFQPECDEPTEAALPGAAGSPEGQHGASPVNLPAQSADVDRQELVS